MLCEMSVVKDRIAIKIFAEERAC